MSKCTICKSTEQGSTIRIVAHTWDCENADKKEIFPYICDSCCEYLSSYFRDRNWRNRNDRK